MTPIAKQRVVIIPILRTLTLQTSGLQVRLISAIAFGINLSFKDHISLKGSYNPFECAMIYDHYWSYEKLLKLSQ